MTKILILATGGTIAAGKSDDGGLAPVLLSRDIADYISEQFPEVSVEYEDLLSLDSSNIQPEEWRVIAKRTFAALPSYDGVIITHGTDTMAYTAAALSFMLQNLDKSVVLTGSQLPIQNPLTDANTNLYTAVSAVLHGIKGVTVAFDRKIINGTRAVKTSTMGFNAFESVNAPYMAQIMADGLRIKKEQTADIRAGGKPRLFDKMCDEVFLLKLIPGTKPEIFSALEAAGYKGLVIEAFGSGGMHFLNRDLTEGLSGIVQRGMAVVVRSQCLYEKTDLTVYSVGRRVLDLGVIPGMDMTTEAAVTKLMWILGQYGPDDAAKVFAKNIAGEISPAM